MVIVRESSHAGACNILGPLIAETPTRYFYQRRPGHVAFAMRSSRIHLAPCRNCPMLPPWNGQDDE